MSVFPFIVLGFLGVAFGFYEGMMEMIQIQNWPFAFLYCGGCLFSLMFIILEPKETVKV